MSARPIKPREYFSRLLDIPEEEIDYTDNPPTTRADWEDAEVLFPVTAEEFRVIKDLILARRRQDLNDPYAQKSMRRLAEEE